MINKYAGEMCRKCGESLQITRKLRSSRITRGRYALNCPLLALCESSTLTAAMTGIVTLPPMTTTCREWQQWVENALSGLFS